MKKNQRVTVEGMLFMEVGYRYRMFDVPVASLGSGAMGHKT